jgi:hypothetical protein
MIVSNHVEIATKHPWSVRRRTDGLKFVQEIKPEFRSSRGKYIGDEQG